MNLLHTSSQGPTGTAGELCMFGLLRAAGALEARLDEALEPVGLSLPKYGVLTHLAKADEPLTLSELAGRLACVRSNITQLVDRLEAEGLVQRTDDPSDRRIVRATLTPLGAERQAEGAHEVEKVQERFEAALSEADREALGRLLASLR